MPRAFDITAVTDSIRLDASGKGEVAYTVSNALKAQVRARASVVPGPGAKAEWFSIQGDAERGAQLFGRSACMGCHAVRGYPGAVSPIGPNLTHIGTRSTIAAGLFPNDTRHLRLWLKNARLMKPGVAMPTLGIGQIDPVTKATVSPALGGLTDQQIADLVAYLQALR